MNTSKQILMATCTSILMLGTAIAAQAINSEKETKIAQNNYVNAVPVSSAVESENDTNIKINQLLMRYRDLGWQYSEDGGKTWSQTPPEGIQTNENGDVSVWQGEGASEDIDSIIKETEEMIKDIIDKSQEYIDSAFEGIDTSEGSFFSFGDVIAKNVDGKWQYSEDAGETWTDTAPEGIDVGEDGRIKIGDDFSEFEEWNEIGDKEIFTEEIKTTTL